MNRHTKTLTAFLAATVLLCGALLTSGCAGKQPSDNNPASPTGDLTQDLALELITKVAINEMLNGDEEIAAYVVTGTGLFIAALDGGQITLPAEVDVAVKEWIAETDLESATKASLSSAYDVLKANYLARIDAGQLDPETTAPIRTIATWVQDAAADTIRYGADFSYEAPPIPEESAAKYDLGTKETIWILRILMFWLWLNDDSDSASEPASYSTAQLATPPDESLLGWATDKRTRERYPLFQPAHTNRVDPKFHDGLRWMLRNPQPAPEGI